MLEMWFLFLMVVTADIICIFGLRARLRQRFSYRGSAVSLWEKRHLGLATGLLASPPQNKPKKWFSRWRIYRLHYSTVRNVASFRMLTFKRRYNVNVYKTLSVIVF